MNFSTNFPGRPVSSLRELGAGPRTDAKRLRVFNQLHVLTIILSQSEFRLSEKSAYHRCKMAIFGTVEILQIQYTFLSSCKSENITSALLGPALPRKIYG